MYKETRKEFLSNFLSFSIIDTLIFHQIRTMYIYI